ncbi:aminopeptidase O-like isoform X2 [Mercenaria mercenaria]|uniref:aminopeptidase O-like isoform X2 n=1 Tax=Mercenaria mercenaria TaxID=6596 RepID=UPI00234EEE90|nr:aminopeptidase O-like isoform X2 [Mercenaria mercenaria]
MAEDERINDLDLPLHSNIEDVQVAHYNIELKCDMNNEVFSGRVILILAHEELAKTKGQVSQFSLTQGITDLDGLEHIKTTRTGKCMDEINNEEMEDIDYEDGSEVVGNHQIMTSLDREETRRDETRHSEQGCTESLNIYQKYTDTVVTQQESSYDLKKTVIETLDNPANLQRVDMKVDEQTVIKIHNVGLESSGSQFEKTYEDDTDQDMLFKASDTEHGTKVSCDHNYTKVDHENKQIDETAILGKSLIYGMNEPVMKDIPEIHKDFVMVLDAWDLIVTSVQMISFQNTCFVLDNECNMDKTKLNEVVKTFARHPLEFCSEKTCLKFWKPGIQTAKEFPRCIEICYQTQPCGPSLKWTKDQDGRPCVYTHGHWINNRSLFPSQDVPGALATWQAYIQVPAGMTVLMSGDQDPEIRHSLPDQVTFIYHTGMEVPSSTLALAVGCWEEVEVISHSRSSPENSCEWLPCRLFTPRFYKDIASTLLCSYIPRCMEAAVSLLGPHPFKRLDILIVPASFASLGMASPSLMFLSQSVLSQDGHMLVRVAHELSHSWFGLAIGPRDWHEEWLSEGFCTYTESVIHGRVTELTEEEFKEERDIYDYLKYRILEAEVQSTGNDLQTLRKAGDDKGAKFVSNGMNPDKGFLQLHYLKGYFLLRHLEDTVGCSSLYGFLKDLVKTFLHKLIDSVDVLELFFNTFPHIRSASLSENTIFQDWLNSPGLPKISGNGCLKHNRLVEEVTKLKKKVCDCNLIWTRLHWRKRRKLDLDSKLQIPKLKQVQILLLLDRLLEEKKLHHNILHYLNEKLWLSTSNADVRHKWCELVIKHKFQDSYKDVGHFLVHCQAMGVYLFGELMISQDREQRQLAEEHFVAISDEMEEGVRKVVETMVYGS